MKNRIIATAIGGSLLISNTAHANLSQFQGVWTALDGTDEGRAVDARIVSELTLTIWQDKYILSLPDGHFSMTIQNNKSEENGFTLIRGDGQSGKRRFDGNYSMTDGILTISYSPEAVDSSSNGDQNERRIFRWRRSQQINLPLGSKSFRNSLGMQFSLILPNTFVAGAQSHEPRRQDEIQRRITISRPYYIGIHEVTVGQYKIYKQEVGDSEEIGGISTIVDGVTRYSGSSSWDNPGFEQGDNHPVIFVSWKDAVAYCDWLSKKEGRKYRLPTEAEWENAARGGSQTAYWWGDEEKHAKGRANIGDMMYAKSYPNRDFRVRHNDGYVFTAPVGSFRPNQFGLYDVSGNAMEWVDDWWNLPSVQPQRDPSGPKNGTLKVAKGGGWANKPGEARSAFRFRENPELRFGGTGFRILLETQ
ncbi:MAG: SUMF1/EgtB/PvdO family nonheme iron enzyme [Parasphingorhabdus sp.]|uniref:SUMF1/EgtB/PvdO family nonheme iron enzyme n=1 Tax=Parasphingorhabdus sp. TaxID=2709688 RepID=UPI003299FACD